MRLLFLTAILSPLAAAIWPLPVSYSSGSTVLWIQQNVEVSYDGPDNVGSMALVENPDSYGQYPGNGPNGLPAAQQIVQAAIQRTYNTIFNNNFVPWMFHPRGSNFEPDVAHKSFITSIHLKQNALDPAGLIKADIDESYTLSLTESGEVTITAVSSIGIVRGLTTFSQLFFQHSKGGSYTTLAPVYVEDAPKFSYRGLNMDLSRNFFPVKDIKRTIDGLGFSKFNRMHLHATDAQSWPLEIPALPELAEKGAYGPGMTYSPTDIQDIQYYAALQGIEVIVEIDTPGHTSSIWFSHPELIAAFNAQPDWDTYCAEPPCGTLKLNSPAVDDFIGKLYSDLLPRLSPYSTYYHTGGDEVNPNAYLLDETVRSNDTAVVQPLIQKFVDLSHQYVRKAGLTPVVWEEMLLQWNLTLGSDVVVQTWQSDEAVAEAVNRGHKTLAGNYNYWYLDCGRGQWLDFQPGASSKQYWPYADYCSPSKNWRLIYSYDPLQGIPEDKQDLVIGGECHLWMEQTDPVNLDDMLWPRAAAAGEVLWSGAKDAQGNNRSQVEASPRLSEMRERLVARGIAAEPIQMPFCIMNGTQCAL